MESNYENIINANNFIKMLIFLYANEIKKKKKSILSSLYSFNKKSKIENKIFNVMRY